jgi:hypothetical protein
MADLNELYEQYRAGTLERKDFEEQICKRLFEHQRTDAQGRTAFLFERYPGIKQAIDTYKNIDLSDISFEAYIFSKMYWAGREARRRSRLGNVRIEGTV